MPFGVGLEVQRAWFDWRGCVATENIGSVPGRGFGCLHLMLP